MARSLANGDYTLLSAFQSASREEAWYRVLADRRSGALSYDCPGWILKAAGERTCVHTETAATLAASGGAAQAAHHPTRARVVSPDEEPLVGALVTQWPGLGGVWSLEERAASLKGKAYHLVPLRLDTASGTAATALVTLAARHGLELRQKITAVASWGGYTIAAYVARAAGFPLAGAPPEHFKVTAGRGAARGPVRHPTSGHLREPGRRTDARRAGRGDPGDVPRAPLWDAVRAGLSGRAQHPLHARPAGLPPLRRDPARWRERRVRVFERGRYVRDLCIVCAEQVPEADHLLTLFLGLISDEAGVLGVVRAYNVFPPHSDGPERETVPAVWAPRSA